MYMYKLLYMKRCACDTYSGNYFLSDCNTNDSKSLIFSDSCVDITLKIVNGYLINHK